MGIFLPYPRIRSREQRLLKKQWREKKKELKQQKKKKNSVVKSDSDNKIAGNKDDSVESSSNSSTSGDTTDSSDRDELAEKVYKRMVDPIDCAVIIPTHNSAGIIAQTVRAAARYVPYRNIFIMDNGPIRTEANIQTEKVVSEISKDINYYYFPIPSKAVNLFLGSVAASSFKYLFVLDDDTIFPEGFCWPSRPEGKTTSSGFSICAVNSQRKREGLVVKLQDWEYKTAGYRKYVQVTNSSVV